MFGIKNNKDLQIKVSNLEKLNTEIQAKTNSIVSENQKMASMITQFGYQVFTGETTTGELGAAKEVIIEYPSLRVRSWQFLLTNHIASLIASKTINWKIGSGLLFNATPSDKPFKDYYGEKEGEKKHRDFIRDIEYQYRNFANTTSVDYENEKNLHGIARHIEYNSFGDGDVLILQRVKKGLAFPNIQVISGQCVVDPYYINDEIAEDHTVCEGVEKNKNGEIVAYHVLIDTNLANGVYKPNPSSALNYGTRRIPVYFKGTKIKQAWLYRSSDLMKAGETRSTPPLSQSFETIEHLNNYLIANAKNAELKSKLVIALEKDANSTGEKVFADTNLPGGMSDTPTDNTNVDVETAICAQKTEIKMGGNGVALDLPKGVKAAAVNPTAQSDQADFMQSALKTLFANNNTPYEVMLSTYGSNYSASMGARSDYQHTLDVLTQIGPANQLYRMNYNVFIYLQILKGDIICPPLANAYKNNDIITIAAITSCKFEGTKLKPIDPLKFIKALKEQVPEKYRDTIAYNTLENIINAVSGGDYESVEKQFSNEVSVLPEELKPVPEPIIKPSKTE